VTHQVLALGPEFVILASEGHDLCRIASTSFAADPIAVKAGTVDDEVSFVVATGGLDAPRTSVMQLLNFGGEVYSASLLLYFLDQGVGDRSVIDYAFLRNAQSG